MSILSSCKQRWLAPLGNALWPSLGSEALPGSITLGPTLGALALLYVMQNPLRLLQGLLRASGAPRLGLQLVLLPAVQWISLALLLTWGVAVVLQLGARLAGKRAPSLAQLAYGSLGRSWLGALGLCAVLTLGAGIMGSDGHAALGLLSARHEFWLLLPLGLAFVWELLRLAGFVRWVSSPTLRGGLLAGLGAVSLAAFAYQGLLLQRFWPELRPLRAGDRLDLGQLARETGMPALESLAGQVVLVEFWASWCGPCLVSLPEVAELLRSSHKQPLGAALVNVDLSEQALPDWLRRAGFADLPVLRDTQGKLQQRFNVHMLPTSFILDKDGTIRHILHAPASAETLAALLAQWY